MNNFNENAILNGLRGKALRAVAMAAIFLWSFGSTFAQVLSEGFNNSTLPTGWTQEFVTGTTNWNFGVANNGNSTITPFAGSGMAEFRTTTSGNATKLVTPAMDLSSLTAPYLIFNYANVNWSGDIDELRVYYKTSATGSWTLIPGAVYTTEQAAWKEVDITLPAAVGATTYYLGFEGTSNYARGLDLDDVVVGESPSCPKPTALMLGVLTDQTADLSWTAGGVETQWNISWGTPGYTPGDVNEIGTGTANTTATYQITGLSSNTTYSAYIRAYCGVGDSSLWVGPISFKTDCSAMVAPWLYDVETATATTNSTIGDCWGSSPSGNSSVYRWDVVGNGGSTPSSNTGPDSPHSGQKYFYTEASYGSTGDSAFLFTPLIDISSLTSPYFKFYYHMYGSTIGELVAQVSDDGGATWQTVTSITGEQQTSGAAPWKKFRSTLPGSLNNPIQIRFVGIRGNDFYGDISIDDIEVLEAPSCPSIVSLTLDSVAITTSNISWTAGGTETQWNISWGTPGFTPGDTNEVGTGTASTNSMYQVTGLNPNTTYDVYVQANCGTDSSEWEGPIAFTTNCSTDNIPYTMPIDAVTTPNIPNCTSIETISGNAWVTASAPTGYTGKVLRYNYNSAAANSWIYTNGLNLTGGTDYQVTFKYGNNSTAYVEKLAVAFGNANDATAMTNSIFDNSNINDKTPHVQTSYFTPSTSGVYYIGFQSHATSNQFYLYLDSIVVEVAPNCRPVANLSLTGKTNQTANVSWTVNGTETQWNISWGTPGYTPGDINEVGTGTASTNPTYQVTGLNANTAYHVYVQANCGTDSSTWYGPLSFSTNCNPGSIPFFEGFESGYVTATPVDGCWSQEDISGTSAWNTNNNVTSYNQTPRTGSWNASLKYSNKDYLFYQLQLTAGTIYTLEFYARQDGTSGASIMATLGTNGNSASNTDTLVPLTAVTSGNYQKFSDHFTVPTSGLYFLGIKGELTSSPWYLSIDDISVDVCTPPTVNLGGNQSICAGSNLVLDAGNAGTGATYLWNDNSTGQTLTVTSAGTYSVTVTNGCSATASVVVTQLPSPSVNLGADTSMCMGDSIILDAGAWSSYSWSDGTSLGQAVANTAGTYSVTVTDNNGCVGVDSILVSVNQLPVVNLGADTSYCQNSSIVLHAGNQNGTYLWNDGSSNDSLLVTTPGTYSVALTDTNQCVGVDSINISESPLPSFDSISVVDNGNCSYTFQVVNPANVDTYHWTLGDGTNSSATSPTHAYTTNGTFNVFVVLSNDCGSVNESKTVTCSTIGVNETSIASQIELFPNPTAKDVFIMNNSGIEIHSIMVIDNFGRVIYESNSKENLNNKIDISELSNGFYLIKIDTEKGMVTKKLEVMK